VYVFGDDGGYEIEGLRIAELEMLMSGYLRFVNLKSGVTHGNGPIPILYGAILPKLGEPDQIPGYCTNLYLVEPEGLQTFIETTDPVATATCGQPLIYNELDV
jgi:hypothetical protein